MGKKWTKQEAERLREEYPKLTNSSKDLEVVFGRCWQAIKNKAYELKISRFNDNNKFFIKVLKDSGVFGEDGKYPTECWQWIGGKDSSGYGVFRCKRSSVGAHRWIYERLRGPIPEGLVIDHLCRNRACVNVDHMEIVTPKENNNRGRNNNREKEFCPRGHKYSEENTYINPGNGGSRVCRECMREKNRIFRLNQKKRTKNAQ